MASFSLTDNGALRVRSDGDPAPRRRETCRYYWILSKQESDDVLRRFLGSSVASARCVNMRSFGTKMRQQLFRLLSDGMSRAERSHRRCASSGAVLTILPAGGALGGARGWYGKSTVRAELSAGAQPE
jgi:hypothetical protein